MTDVANDGAAPTVTPNPDQLAGDYDARAVKLLRVRRRVGQGTVDDPVRIAVSLWTEAGDLIHEIDPARQKSEREELLEEALKEALEGWSKAENAIAIISQPDPSGVQRALLDRAEKRIALLRALL